MNKEEKKKTKTLRRPWKIIVSFAVIAFSAILCYVSFHELYTTILLRKEIDMTSKRVEENKATEEKLNEMIKKLQDPEFIKMYARSKFFMTKDGEQIYHTSGKEQSSDQENE